VSFGEGSTGAGLEIPLEREGLVGLLKVNGDNEAPRTKLGSVNRRSRVVLGNSRREMIGASDVVPAFVSQALK
jgi:hypothetical protein